MTYKELVDKINANTPVRLALRDRSIGMEKHHHPLSLTEKEFNFIKSFIVDRNLKRGYEVATAFGISALAAGLGFKETGGKLVSMDAYIEEQYNLCDAYVGQRGTYKDTDGYKSATYISELFGTPTAFEVGWSPDNTQSVLAKHFDLATEKLDYVFIDAGHWDSAIKADLSSVLPYLNRQGFAVFFHDAHCHTSSTNKFISDNLGIPLKTLFDVQINDNYGLAVATNLVI